MTNATATPHYNAPRASAPQPEITGWSGWIVFGAMMMLGRCIRWMTLAMVKVFPDPVTPSSVW